ncbi:MAG TPA: metallopeptidase family protein [Candidatus Angelobacter sp.]
MERERFVQIVAKVLDSLPQEFRSRIRNVSVLVEDKPPDQPSPRSGKPKQLLLGLFHGVPRTRKSVFDLATGPDYVVLYQKNIEAVCSSEAEIHEQIRLTVIHELGHYFGMDEDQLRNV